MTTYPVHPGALEAYEVLSRDESPFENEPEDVRRYARLAAGAQSVLEYGAGRGEVTLAMARAGARVVAVDLSFKLIQALGEVLRAEPAAVRRRVTAREGDMRSLRLARRFPLVVAPSSTFSHLYSRTDVEAFLARARAHLAPGGRLVFDLEMPRLPRLPRPEAEVSSHDLARAVAPSAASPSGAFSCRTEYDPLAQVASMWCSRGSHSVFMAKRLFFPRELELLLHAAGFVNVRLRALGAGTRGAQPRLWVSCRSPCAALRGGPC